MAADNHRKLRIQGDMEGKEGDILVHKDSSHRAAQEGGGDMAVVGVSILECEVHPLESCIQHSIGDRSNRRDQIAGLPLRRLQRSDIEQKPFRGFGHFESSTF
jgi:hypothetical protein